MVKLKFPQVILIENKVNVGFSKANNQAMKLAKGEYILLLNPDTVVEESTFEKTVDFMDQHDDAGGLGVYMIDGKGNFLPESKRGLPTPWVAFYKIFGLSKLFPNSKKFNRYYLGNLSNKSVNEIEILSGAFMLMRKSALDKVGLLDEAFFMYGEDIDLSWRIINGGYKNYYFPETKIIHYKGESTKKTSVNYVFVFYNAMIIFAKKHFSQKNAKVFTFLIKSAIYFRAGLALFNRFLKQIWVPFIDAAVIIGGLFLTQSIYHSFTGIQWPIQITQFLYPAFTLILLFFGWIAGGYDKPFKPVRLIKGLLIGGLALLSIYALLPKDWQISRALILITCIWALTGMTIVRFALNLLNIKGYKFGTNHRKKLAIIGKEEECERVENILSQTNIKTEFIKRIYPNEEIQKDGYSGNLSQLNEIIHFYKIDEVIFCAQNTSAQSIMHYMSEINNKHLDFKIAQPDSLFIIGSNSVNTSGEMYVLELNSIGSTQNQRFKRLSDVVIASMAILLSPLLLFVQKNPLNYFPNLIQVLLGKLTLVGYFPMPSNRELPKIRKGIFFPDNQNINNASEQTKERLNLVYAKDYTVFNDWKIVLNNLRNLGNSKA